MWVEIPLETMKDEIETGFGELLELAAKLPEPHQVKFYGKLNTLWVNCKSYQKALENGEKFILATFHKKLRGPKGKSLLELKEEFDCVQAELKRMIERCYLERP